MELEIEKSLVASTGHIHWATSRWLDADAAECHLYVTAYEEGWRICVGSSPLEPDPRIPTDLYVLMKLAADNGCKWLHLDCDGPTLTGYQCFNWEAEKKARIAVLAAGPAGQPVEPRLVYADLSQLTPLQILQAAEDMADEFYRLEGCGPPIESYRLTDNPRAGCSWQQVKVAYWLLAATDLDDVVSELDAEG